MFKTRDEAGDFLRDRRQSASMTRNQLSRSIGQSQCYFQGLQWFYSGMGPGMSQSATTGRKLSDWNPDSAALRATVNRMSKHVIKAAAATHPSDLDADVFPPDSDSGVDAAYTAGILERLNNCSLKYSGFLDQAQDAQFARCVCGTWGLGFYLDNRVRSFEGMPVPDRCIKAFTFDPTRLMLDPACTSRRLKDHDTVVYEDAWTADKIRRVFPDYKLDESKMQTVGNLMSNELLMNTLSQGNLYQNYRIHSNTKGAMVSQVHTKGVDGRFGEMYVFINGERGDECLNFDDPRSPFGGDGLPLFLLHGHRRPMSPWSIGECQMTKDDQDRMNLLMTLYFRMIQAHGGFQWMLDKRSRPKDTSEEQFRSNFSNRIANVILYDGGTAAQRIPEPRLVQYPTPPQTLMDDMERFEGGMQQQVSQSPGNYGLGAKSHVPYQTTDRLLEEAGQVLGIRVQDDKQVYEDAERVLVGTQVKLLKEENPGTLVFLRKNGFEQDDFAALLAVDEYDLSGNTLAVRESKIRFRSVQSKQQSLDRAADLQAVNPMQYRMALADWDIPVTQDDQQMHQELNRAVHLLLNGQPWQPLPLGEYQQMALTRLRRALFDKKARENPQIKAAVLEAIVMQEQAIAHEQALMQPAVPAEGQPTQQAEQPPNEGGTIEDVLNQLASPGGMAGQPSPAAA